MDPITFILNDENVINSYGFRVLTKGIDLSRFENNPVMLKQHQNNVDSVIGKWINITKKKGRLLADSEFDMEDEEAAKIAGKVERGFIKATSMGLGFIIKKMEIIDDVPVAVESELFEASIVAVPSNKNSVRLYNESGQLLQEQDVENLLLSFQNDDSEIENPKIMKQQLITMAALVALSLQEDKQDSKEAISAAIVQLKSAHDKLELKVQEFEQKEKDARENEITSLLSAAQKDGRITAPQVKDYKELAEVNFSVFKTTLENLPKKKELSTKDITDPEGNAVSTMDDFQKLTVQEQIQFKSDFPEEYNKIVESINS